MKFTSEPDIIDRLRDRIGYKRSQTKLAEELGISRSYLCELLAGAKVKPGPEILKALGYDPTPYYRKANP